MDYLKGYRLFRQDPDWTSKMFVGGVMLLSTACIPILGQVLLTGWRALVLRRAVRGLSAPMPRLDFDTNYLGKLAHPGFKGLIVQFVWTLPLVVIFMVLFMCLYFGVVVGAIAASESGADEAGLFIVCCASGSMLIMMPLVVALTIPAAVAAMRAELTDDMQAGFEVKAVLDFSKANFGVLLKGSLVLYVVTMIVTGLGALACYFPAFFVAVIGMYAHALFMAQVYVAHVERGGEALELAPYDLDAPPG